MQLSYRGAPFLGWQIQPQGATVQGVIEDALAKLLRQKTCLTGAGRTDTGVNARMMIAHFDSDAFDECAASDIAYRLNSMVGKDIAIEKIWKVRDDAHARFDATERTYRYFATTNKSPFLYPLAWQAPANIDFSLMNLAAESLIGRQDFTSFSKLHTQVKTNICELRRARWVKEREDIWYFEISADRFLRNMVRAIVGTLVDIGRGKNQPSSVKDIIECRNRCSAGTSMPPQGLFLWDIKYPTQ